MGRILVAAMSIVAAIAMQHIATSYPAAAARFPTLLGYVVICLGLMAAGQVLLEWRRLRLAGTLQVLPRADWRKIAIGSAFTLLIVLYAWSIPVLGYLLATPLMLAIPLALLRPVGWTAAAITVVAVTGTIWGVFVWFLRLPIPLYPGA